MDYAIQTMEIELYKVRDMLRTMRAISAEIRARHPEQGHYEEAEKEIVKAIDILKGQE